MHKEIGITIAVAMGGYTETPKGEGNSCLWCPQIALIKKYVTSTAEKNGKI